MNSSRILRGAAVPTVAVLAIAAFFAVLGGGVLGRGTDASPDPSPSPIVTPSAPPSPGPTVPPAATPTSPVVPTVIDLESVTGHDISVVIDDETDLLVDAESGQPGDGMSVRWSEVTVENLDSRTIRLTWAGYARDETVELSISRDADGYEIRIAQGMPYPNTDAMGQDRVLVLEFEASIAAADVQALAQDLSFLDD